MQNLKVFPLILLLIVSCNRNDRHQNNTKLQINKIRDITLKSDSVLIGKFKERFKINEDNTLWAFSDRIQNKVFIFDSEGKFVSRIGESNKGPKGIIQIMGFDFRSDSSISIFDASQRLIKTFQVNGMLLQSNQFFTNSKIGFATTELNIYQDKFILPIWEMKVPDDPLKSKQLALFDESGSLDTLFGEYDKFIEIDNHYSQTHNYVIDESRDRLYINLNTSPYIQEYDLKSLNRIDYFGNITPSFSIPEKEISPYLSVNEISKRAVGRSAGRGIYVTDEYIILHYQVLTEEWFETTDFSKKRNVLIVYNKENKQLLGELKVKHTLAASAQNYLYFIEDFNPDNYTLGVYEIVAE